MSRTFDRPTISMQTERLLAALRRHHPERCMPESNVCASGLNLDRIVLVPVLGRLADGKRKAVQS